MRTTANVQPDNGLNSQVIRAGDQFSGDKSGLDPFTAGYIAAMRASMSPDTQDYQLADETLAAILKDCAAAQTDPVLFFNTTDPKCAASGARFWRDRGLTPYLGDDGEVHLRSVQS